MISADVTAEPHEPHWISRATFPLLLGLFLLSQAGVAIAVYQNRYWLVVLLALVTSHLMHGLLIAFHEASHSLLRKSRILNDIDGFLIGVFSFTSFTLYRAAHQLHHAHLSTERDEELWPFVHPTASRPVRILAAVLELTVGMLFTPFLFLRIFLRKGSPIRSPKVRRQVWIEMGLIALIWAAILTADALFGGWKYFLWMYLVPAWLAGNMQSIRKYVEHVGLTGSTVNSSTRAVVAQGWMADFISFTLLHEPYHAVHHWRAGLPHTELPLHPEALEPSAPGERPPFRTFGAAVHDLLIHLPDPKVGAQWLGQGAQNQPELAGSEAN